MNQASYTSRPFLAAIGGAAATLFTPSHCWAAGEAVLPWDYTLEAIQNFVAGPLAQAVIVVSSIVAMLAFTLAGDSELVRRFVKTVVVPVSPSLPSSCSTTCFPEEGIVRSPL